MGYFKSWPPYNFDYNVTDESGTMIFHTEKADSNNTKTGTYGYRDPSGIYRTVNYVADADGFRATIDTNEPGTAAGMSADAVFNAMPVMVPTPPGGTAPRPRPAGAGPAYTPPRYSRPGSTMAFALGQVPEVQEAQEASVVAPEGAMADGLLVHRVGSY
ncbi:hypothetical protein HPB48_021429 [Haemaphysalis longicornis]|uniref:Cuticle protein n=1 Tax=Haemaphysalis longicornis TaxID=44386 RepID=A0A9J6GB09_HAELO|nr:hypothetical protein HPB48_021429 [Haemaphysalis longicornis]